MAPTVFCAACGPTSLHGDRHEATECALSKSGCHPWDHSKYLKCNGCNKSYGLDCLRNLSGQLAKFEASLVELQLHDPQLVWRTLRDLPWLEDTEASVLLRAKDAGFKPQSQYGCAQLEVCFQCEDGPVPEPTRPPAAQVFKNLLPDKDGRVVLLVPLEELTIEGNQTEAEVRVIDFVNFRPRVPTEYCERLFRDGPGTREEVGGVRSHPPSPAPTRPVPHPPSCHF